MPSSSTPNTTRRPSTLAAGKALAAQQPVGMRPRPVVAANARGTNAGGAPPSTGQSVRGDAAGAKSKDWDRYLDADAKRDGRSARAASKTGPAILAVKSAVEQPGSHRLLIGVLALLGALVAVAGGMKATSAVAESKAATSIEGLLANASLHETQFHVELNRFATWPELEERGLRLPRRQQVVRSSADASHWFLRVRDRKTGVECDRIGELVVDPTAEIRSTCRTETRVVRESAL